jgi:hypothetical protein
MRYPGAMRHLVSIGIVALCTSACATGGKPKASSRPQVVVLDIEGASAPVQTRVEELTARRFDVIDADTYWDAARRLKAKKLTRRNIARVASELGAVALVHGKATGKKRRQVVTVYVRAGDSGKLLERYRLTVRNGVVAKKGKRRLERKLLARVKGTAPPAEQADEEADSEETATAATAPARAEGAPAADEEEEPPLPAVKYDEEGQAVDDELPPM